MFIYIAKDEDDDLGPPLDVLICAECGHSCGAFNYSGKYVHKEFSYKVLKHSLRCKKCGHTDYIVADNKGSYIDMELFSGEYDLDNIREEAKKKEQLEKTEKIASTLKKPTWKEYWKGFFSIDSNESKLKQIKEILSDLARLGSISLSIILLLGLILVIIISTIILSLVLILSFIGIYYLIGFFTTSMALRIYIAATVVFSIFEIVRPFVGKKASLLLEIISWPIKIYNYTEFPYIFQFVVLFVVTVINLGDFRLMNDNVFWDTISRSLYPAIVTSILLREITDRHQYKSPEVSRKASDIAEQIKEAERKEEQHWNEKSKIVDSLYIEVLKCYFEQTSLDELEKYFPNVYRIVNNDFSSIINELNASARKSITIAKIIDQYCALHDESIICSE